MEEAHIVSMEENEIVIDPDLLESIARKVKTLGKPNETYNSTIFRVPYKFRQSKENLFKPSTVSIGPFHHSNTRVQAVEQQKWQILRDFLSRGDHITLDLCLSEVKKLEERTRRCYSESVPLSSNRFVKMMLLDGCFVLEYFLKWYENRLNSIGHSVFPFSDLLLLENQIPFFIVEKLYEIGTKPEDRSDFKNYIANFFANFFAHTDGAFYYKYSIFEIRPHHLVHLCYHSLIPIDLREPFVSSSESFSPSMLSRILPPIAVLLVSCCTLPKNIKNLLHDFPLWMLTRIFPKRKVFLSLSFLKSTLIPCATELQNAGIKLRPKNKPYCMLDISFNNGVLKIPELIITIDSKTLLANLIVFEQQSIMSAKLSSFALFLDSLVNTPEDVMILRQCGIINNCLNSDEELTNFFNQMCKGLDVEDDHFLVKLSKAVNKYCDSKSARWHIHKTQFIDTYFRSPWTAISLVAAVVIVLLTFVQAFFAVLAYFVPPS